MNFLISQISRDKHKQKQDIYDTWYFDLNYMSLGQ